MFIDSFLILLPLILLVTGGAILSGLYSLSEDTLVRIVTDFFMPLLVFSSLYTSNIRPMDAFKIGGAVSFVLLLLLLLSIGYSRLFKLDIRSFVPPIIFMNSGFLGIPLMDLWGGAVAMNQIVIYDQIQTFYIFTIGIIIVTGGLSLSGIIEIVKTPLLWSIILGFGFRFAAVDIPGPLIRAISYAGAGAPALATFALGCSLKNRKMKIDIHLFAGLILRFVFGFFAGAIAAYILNMSGKAAMVIIVASALPSAVFSVVLPLRYGVDARYAGGMVIVSTILSVFILPIVFYLSELVLVW